MFITLHDIEKGALVTACYLPRCWALAPRAVRRHILQQTKLFDCACERCASLPDTCGAVPCPGCSGRTRDPATGLLPLAGSAAVPLSRHLVLHPARKGPTGGGDEYVCGSCGARAPPTEAAIFGGPAAVAAARASLGVPIECASVEEFLRERLLAADAAPQPPADLRRLCADAARALG